MLEYVFFDHRPYERFLEYLRGQGVDPKTKTEDDLYEVHVPENLDEELGESIENFYDEMMDLNLQLFEQDQGSDDEQHTAGVVVSLQSGQTIYADVNPELLGRIMSVLTPQEFGDVVNAIVDALEQPDERTLCQRGRHQVC